MAEYIEKWSIVNRLIDIENEFQQYKPFHGFEHAMYRKICEAEIAIGKTQAADVATVRHGRWIDKGEYAVCMECGGRSGTQYDGVEPIPLMTQFCPNCGCRMDGGTD